MLKQLRKLYGCLTFKLWNYQQAYTSNKLYTPEGYYYYLQFYPTGVDFEEGRSHMLVTLIHQHPGQMQSVQRLQNEDGKRCLSFPEIPPAIEKALFREKQNLEAVVALGVQVPTRQV